MNVVQNVFTIREKEWFFKTCVTLKWHTELHCSLLKSCVPQIDQKNKPVIMSVLIIVLVL